MTMTTVDTNAYWEAVKDHVHDTGLWGGREVGSPLARSGSIEDWVAEVPQRHQYVKRYSWTITDPATVAFVARWSNGALVDPMAGTGWWAHVLQAHGVQVACFDADPGGNHWHQGESLWTTVDRCEAATAVRDFPDRTLFLAWPPYDRPDGVETLRAYGGNRLILIHEGEGGCVGDDALFEELAANWSEVAEHVPVQWFGMHDRVTVYDRKATR